MLPDSFSANSTVFNRSPKARLESLGTARLTNQHLNDLAIVDVFLKVLDDDSLVRELAVDPVDESLNSESFQHSKLDSDMSGHF